MRIYNIIARSPMYATGFIIAAPSQKQAIEYLEDLYKDRGYTITASSVPELKKCTYDGEGIVTLLTYSF